MSGLVSAEDDRFGTAATARKIAEIVPHSELTILPDGGHIWLGHRLSASPFSRR